MADTQTKQLTVKAADTYTPTKEDQIISSGVYLTGDQTVKGDANLLPQNIISGKTLFGVIGTADASTTILYSNKIIVNTGCDGCTVSCTDVNNQVTNAVYKDDGKYYLEGLTWGTYIVSAEKGELKTSNTVVFEDNLINTTKEININLELPDFAYTGEYNFVYDDENINNSLDWKLKLLTGGKLKFNSLNAADGIDIFLVGGGASGGCYNYSSDAAINEGGRGGGGGGGGYTKTIKKYDTSNIEIGKIYDVTIGSGGLAVIENGNLGNSGGITSIFDVSVEGGKCSSSVSIGGNGGSGGGGSGGYVSGNSKSGGKGGSDGLDGVTSAYSGGKGQGTSTREFGEYSGKLYSGGGGGGGCSTGISGGVGGDGGGGNGAHSTDAGNGTTNSGGGGGGGAAKMNYLGASQGYRRDPKNPGNGGSGIIIIRNTKIFSMIDFEYTGYYELVDDNDNPLTTSSENWKLRLLSSGKLKFNSLRAPSIDVFLVGGGGGGSTSSNYAAGGGGYTRTEKNISVELNKEYEIIIGEGGEKTTSHDNVHDGTESSAFGFKAAGGKGGQEYYRGGNGGSGGTTSGGKYGQDGYDSTGGENYPGKGQRTTPGPNGETGSTREFGETTGKLYASGGGQHNGDEPISTVGINCGFGGNMVESEINDGTSRKGKGYPGIVVIRNARS